MLALVPLPGCIFLISLWILLTIALCVYEVYPISFKQISINLNIFPGFDLLKLLTVAFLFDICSYI